MVRGEKVILCAVAAFCQRAGEGMRRLVVHWYGVDLRTALFQPSMFSLYMFGGC